MTRFTELDLPAPLQQAVDAAGYVAMTPVQAAALPPILAGRDVIAEAQTGSGKTAAFALGLLVQLDPQLTAVQGLVLCPTRELADQVSREIRGLARFVPNVKVLTLCGGVPLRPHLASLAHLPHVAVGTPGRLLELIERGALPLSALRVLVLDEADRMLDMGFADDIAAIAERTPQRRQTLLFSATIPDEIRAISRRYQRDAIDIVIPADAVDVEQTFFEIEPARRFEALTALLLKHRPEAALVFCNTREDVRRVADALDERGFASLALHGELDQRERDETLVQFSNRSANVLVASDVAARGLDIAGLAMVVNFELPPNADSYVHRIGRTGRAGAPGLAFSLVAPRERERAAAIERRRGEPLYWQRVPLVSGETPLEPAFATLAIDAGRQDRVRPGDVLGALTGAAGVAGESIGRIDVFPTRTYVAVAREQAGNALAGLRAGTIKGRRFRVRRLGPKRRSRRD